MDLTPLTRVERIEALRGCENRIRVVRQDLEAEARGEAMANTEPDTHEYEPADANGWEEEH